MASVVLASDGTCYDLAHNAWFCAQYWSDRSSDLRHATDQHIQLVVYSILLSLVLSFPLALVARRFRITEPAILGSATIVYTIPSLALFSLLLPIWGLTMTTVVIGLALYAITILIRNILAGLRVATVSTVALATVGAILGFGGLGNLLFDAVNTQFKAQILAASVLCVGLAVAFDLILLAVGWLLTPWRRSRA